MTLNPVFTGLALQGAQLHTQPANLNQFPRDMTVGEINNFRNFPNLMSSQISTPQHKIEVLGGKNNNFNWIAYSMGYTDRWIDIAFPNQRGSETAMATLYAQYYYIGCPTAESEIDIYGLGTAVGDHNPQHAAQGPVIANRARNEAIARSKMGNQVILQHPRLGAEGGIYSNIYGHFKKHTSYPGSAHASIPAADHPNFHELPPAMPVCQSAATPPFAPIVPQPPTTIHGNAAQPAANNNPNTAGPAPNDHSNTARSGLFRRILNMGASLLGRSYESNSGMPHPRAFLTPRVPNKKTTGTTSGTTGQNPTSGSVSTNGGQTPVKNGNGQTSTQGSSNAVVPGSIPYKRMAANAKIPPPATVAVKSASTTRTAMMKKSAATVNKFDTLFAAWKKTWALDTVSFDSYTAFCAKNQQYTALKALGKPIIPLIVHQLSLGTNHFTVHLYNELEPVNKLSKRKDLILDSLVLQRHANLLVDMNYNFGLKSKQAMTGPAPANPAPGK